MSRADQRSQVGSMSTEYFPAVITLNPKEKLAQLTSLKVEVALRRFAIEWV